MVVSLTKHAPILAEPGGSVNDALRVFGTGQMLSRSPGRIGDRINRIDRIVT